MPNCVAKGGTLATAAQLPTTAHQEQEACPFPRKTHRPPFFRPRRAHSGRTKHVSPACAQTAVARADCVKPAICQRHAGKSSEEPYIAAALLPGRALASSRIEGDSAGTADRDFAVSIFAGLVIRPCPAGTKRSDKNLKQSEHQDRPQHYILLACWILIDPVPSLRRGAWRHVLPAMLGLGDVME